MPTVRSSKIVPHLWFPKNAKEAVSFYVSLLPDSRIDSETTIPSESPSGPANTVQVLEFTLAGQSFMAISAGELDPFNHAISFLVNCDTQAEIDRLSNALSADGGELEPCGWVKDRWGLSWQISASQFGEWMRDPDRKKAGRVMDVFLKMMKVEIEPLRRAYEGR
jgi:predicted 3-demethylubiquinone-9 3-methyltransferase (glyoxalase superfamily)